MLTNDKGSMILLRLRGIPIRAHWSLLLLIPFLAYVFGARFEDVARYAGVPADGFVMSPLLLGGVLALGFVASVLLHELAHAAVALRAGGQVRDITLTALGGVARLERVPDSPWIEGLIAAAGPAASLALAALFYVLHGAAPHGAADPRMGLYYLAHANLALGLFNLLPLYPLDGGRVLRALLAAIVDPGRATRLAAGLGAVGAVSLGLFGVLSGNLMLAGVAYVIYDVAADELREERRRDRLRGLTAADVMTPSHSDTATILRVPPDALALDALDRAAEAGATMIVVVGPAGVALGSFTEADAARVIDPPVLGPIVT